MAGEAKEARSRGVERNNGAWDESSRAYGRGGEGGPEQKKKRAKRAKKKRGKANECSPTHQRLDKARSANLAANSLGSGRTM